MAKKINFKAPFHNVEYKTGRFVNWVFPQFLILAIYIKYKLFES